MICLVTYHPAAMLYASKDKGLSKSAILGAIREDLQRVKSLLNGDSPIDIPSTSNTSTGITSYLGLDTEYLTKGTSPIELLSCAFSDGAHMYSWDKDLEGIDPKLLTSNTCSLVGHNIPEDIALLWEKGWIPRNEKWLRGEDVYDSLLIGKMHNETLASFKLEDLLASYYTVEGWKKETKDRDVTKWSPEERVRRCQLDAWAPVRIVQKLFPELDTPTQQSLYPFTMGIAMTLHRLTLAGAVVDRPKFETLVRELENERQAALSTLVRAAGLVGITDYEPSNDGQTRDILFNRLGLVPISFTDKTKEPQVTKEVLSTLAEDTTGGVQRFLNTLMEYNKLDKIITTYLVGSDNEKAKRQNAIARLAVPLSLENGLCFWLPFRFNSLGAKTARRSSSNPNSQNWPKRIRHLVRPRWSGGRILGADYRKLEPVIIAWLAEDERLLEYFTTGEGYLGIARDLLRTEVRDGTPLYRGVKSIVLGVHYDMQTNEMAKQLWYNHKIRFDSKYEAHWNETDRIRHLYLDAHPALQAYMERRREEAKQTGVVRTPTGRQRHVGGGADKHTLNQAINAPVQSTASDITGAALIGIEEAILQEYKVSLTEWYDYLLAQRRKCLTFDPGCGIMSFEMRIPTMFNEVHDEITVDLPPDHLARDVELVVETMKAVPIVRQLAPFLKDIPLGVDPKLSEYWGE